MCKNYVLSILLCGKLLEICFRKFERQQHHHHRTTTTIILYFMGCEMIIWNIFPLTFMLRYIQNKLCIRVFGDKYYSTNKGYEPQVSFNVRLVYPTWMWRAPIVLSMCRLFELKKLTLNVAGVLKKNESFISFFF